MKNISIPYINYNSLTLLFDSFLKLSIPSLSKRDSIFEPTSSMKPKIIFFLSFFYLKYSPLVFFYPFIYFIIKINNIQIKRARAKHKRIYFGSFLKIKNSEKIGVFYYTPSTLFVDTSPPCLWVEDLFACLLSIVLTLLFSILSWYLLYALVLTFIFSTIFW